MDYLFAEGVLEILLPSISKPVNCSLYEGVVPAGFKKAVVAPLITKASLQCKTGWLNPLKLFEYC